MLADLVNGLDGRDWLTITDQSDGDVRLIEVMPAGSTGRRPEEIVSLTFGARQGEFNAMAYAVAHIDLLRVGRLSGEVTPVFLREMSQDVSFTATITDDWLMSDSFGVYRVLGGRNVAAILAYEHRGPIDSAQKAAWTERMLRVPVATVMGLAGSVRSEVQPSNLLAPLSQIKAYLRSLAAEQPDLATTATSLINGIEGVGKEELGIQRFIRVLGMLTALVQFHNGGGLLTPAAADEFAFEAAACAECFRPIQATPWFHLFHLSLSLLARILVTDPRLDAEKIERGILVSKYLCGLEDKMRLRAEEAMSSFLVGANRIAIVSATHDAVERSEWLISSLRNQPVTVARLLARMIRIPVSGSNAPDRSTWLEHLNRCDMITYMMDTSLPGAEDSSFPGAEPGKKSEKSSIRKPDQGAFIIRDPYTDGYRESYYSIDDMLKVFQTCPPELQLQQQVTENEYWGENRAPLNLLSGYAALASAHAQSKLLGFDYTELNKLSRERASQIDYKRPHGLLLRSFRSMRRLWVEDAFRPDDSEIWPLTSEPRLLTLESALNRALGVKFLFTAIGGGYDDRWRNLKALLHGPVADLPDYRPVGAFVFLRAPDGQFDELPFSAMFSGELSRLLVAKCAGSRAGDIGR
jgi:hypothetical protein